MHGLEPLSIRDLKGLFDRGRDDEVPPDHLIAAHNVQYGPTGVRTRDGSVTSFVTGAEVVRFFFIRNESLGNILLYLDNAGQLYGVKQGVRTPLLNNPLMLDFSITDDRDRIYITPHDGIKGLVGEKIYWWDGTVFAQLGSPAPVSTNQMIAAETGTGTDEVQEIEIINATGGDFKLRTQVGATVALPWNVTAAQLESALRGDNERQRFSVAGATGGTFTVLNPRVGFTAVIPWNATIDQFRNAINDVFNPFGASEDFFIDLNVSSDGGPWEIVFIGALAKQDVPFLQGDGSGLTGPDPVLNIDEVLKGRTLFGVPNVFVTGTNPFQVTWANEYSARPIATLVPEAVNLTGASPSVQVTVITEGQTAGKVEEGLRKLAVAYETAYGFITRPGPVIGGTFSPTEYTGPGGFKIVLSQIPTGPAGTIARHILSTKANEEEFFFVPDGRIPNNTDTTFTVDFFDSDLLESADYLFDLLESVPASLFLVQYAGRMVAGGYAHPDGSLLRISRAGSYESFDAIEGLVTVNPADRFNIKACGVLREILHVAKTQGVHALQENDQEPAFWEKSVPIDNGVGTAVNGISSIPNVTAGSTRDRWFIADVSGLLLFDGVFRRPELTWKIHSVWLRINKNFFHKIQVWDDPVNQRIYINVPLDSAETPTHVLYADYTKGLDYQGIKWSIWKFPDNNPPTSISVFDLAGNGIPIFRYGSISGIWRQCDSDDIHTDNGFPIDGYIETWLMAPEKAGLLNQFNVVRSRINGFGNLQLTVRGQDRLPVLLPPIQVLASAPAANYTRMFNFINERASVEFRMNAVDEWFDMYEAWMFGKQYSVMRPG